mmetsp:Transcript_12918/g.27896  ORF Transcript_12918/g.27896 Transcript_12918/m.27896 type:complete len:224 (-) Transcript_12918:242-913(-)
MGSHLHYKAATLRPPSWNAPWKPFLAFCLNLFAKVRCCVCRILHVESRAVFPWCVDVDGCTSVRRDAKFLRARLVGCEREELHNVGVRPPCLSKRRRVLRQYNFLPSSSCLHGGLLSILLADFASFFLLRAPARIFFPNSRPELVDHSRHPPLHPSDHLVFDGPRSHPRYLRCRCGPTLVLLSIPFDRVCLFQQVLSKRRIIQRRRAVASLDDVYPFHECLKT